MSEEKLVPKLRFSGFDKNWHNILGKEAFELLGGGSFKSKDSVKKGILWLKIANVGINEIKTNELSYLPEDFLNAFNKYILKKGEVILALTRPILDHKLKIAIINDEFNNSLLNQRVGKITPLKNSNIKFIYYYLQLPYSIYYLESKISGSDPPNLSNKDLLNLPIKIPSFEEQQKISQFISLIDEKIGLLKQKHTYYQDFKKYLMQQIFAQKLRFNFSDEWKIVKLESLIKKGKAGGTPSSTNSDYYKGDIPFLSIRDMTEQGKYILKTEKTITEEGLNNSSAWIIPKNSLLYSIYASIGLVAINRSDISTSQAIYGIILKDGVSLEYMYYYLTYFKKNIHKYIETGTQGNLNAKLLKSFEILLPSLEEQEMIVNVLSIVDEKIENSKKEIEKINEFKKGLLQQMFV